MPPRKLPHWCENHVASNLARFSAAFRYYQYALSLSQATSLRINCCPRSHPFRYRDSNYRGRVVLLQFDGHLEAHTIPSNQPCHPGIPTAALQCYQYAPLWPIDICFYMLIVTPEVTPLCIEVLTGLICCYLTDLYRAKRFHVSSPVSL